LSEFRAWLGALIAICLLVLLMMAVAVLFVRLDSGPSPKVIDIILVCFNVAYWVVPIMLIILVVGVIVEVARAIWKNW
jgi:hypothetical protein